MESNPHRVQPNGSANNDGRCPELLYRLVADAERVVDQQLRAGEEMDDKAEHLTKLAVATIGAALTVALFVGGSPDFDATWISVVPFAFGLLLSLLGLLEMVNSYLGFRRAHETHSAPDIRWLEAKRDEREWTLDAHLGSLISSYAAYFEENETIMAWAAGRRRRGLYAIVGAVFSYAFSMVLIAGARMGWL